MTINHGIYSYTYYHSTSASGPWYGAHLYRRNGNNYDDTYSGLGEGTRYWIKMVVTNNTGLSAELTTSNWTAVEAPIANCPLLDKMSELKSVVIARNPAYILQKKSINKRTEGSWYREESDVNTVSSEMKSLTYRYVSESDPDQVLSATTTITFEEEFFVGDFQMTWPVDKLKNLHVDKGRLMFQFDALANSAYTCEIRAESSSLGKWTQRVQASEVSDGLYSVTFQSLATQVVGCYLYGDGKVFLEIRGRYSKPGYRCFNWSSRGSGYVNFKERDSV